jgi:hypothetical protein
MPQGGHSETISASFVTSHDCIQRIDSMVDLEGREIVHPLSVASLCVGHIVEGTAKVVASSKWTYQGRDVGVKHLLLIDSDVLTVEFLGKAWGARIPLIGEGLSFRGRVQRLGPHHRITNPWVSRGSVGFGKPSAAYDLC